MSVGCSIIYKRKRFLFWQDCRKKDNPLSMHIPFQSSLHHFFFPHIFHKKGRDEASAWKNAYQENERCCAVGASSNTSLSPPLPPTCHQPHLTFFRLPFLFVLPLWSTILSAVKSWPSICVPHEECDRISTYSDQPSPSRFFFFFFFVCDDPETAGPPCQEHY